MAESESGGERTEEPSQRRLQEARERGQVPRSRELTTFASTVGGAASLAAVGTNLAQHMMQIMRSSLGARAEVFDNVDSVTHALSSAGLTALMMVLPVFGALLGLVALASVAIGGWNFSSDALIPDFSRLSPVSGLSRIFGLQGFSELGKALLKCVVVGGVSFGVVHWVFKDVMGVGRMSPLAAIGHGAHLLSWSFVWLAASLALVAAVDVPLALFQFKRNLRMTRQELRDESKELDGKPEVKHRIRQMQQTLARRRMMHKVPTADVVITNPTHFAVALKYDPQRMRAPRVLAKGADLVAQNIRKIAQDNRVPIFESPKLARALFRSTDLNKEIPAGLYLAVAQVLSYVFRLRTLNPTLAARMTKPNPQLGEEYEDA